MLKYNIIPSGSWSYFKEGNGNTVRCLKNILFIGRTLESKISFLTKFPSRENYIKSLALWQAADMNFDGLFSL
jgi:hypothetical protein